MPKPYTPKTIAGIRQSAIIEIILMLAVLLLFDRVFLTGNRFWDANPHPFWFVVLLCACKYGTREGILAVAASTLALLLFNLPAQGMDQDSYAYLFSIVKLPLMWLVAATAFGELRQMHIRERTQLQTDLSASEERESTIARSYQWVKELKERLELRMAGQLRSSIGTYHAARAMERLNPGDVLRGIEELVTSALNPEQFSIYSFTPNGLELTLAHGWQEKDSYNRQFDLRHKLTQAIGGKVNVLSVANPDQEQLLAGQGILAGPLTDRMTGEVLGMIKIEKLGFTELNLSSIESFSAICEWAGMALINARKYQTAKSESILNPDHNLLTYNYFRRYLNYISALGKRVGFSVNMIVIHLVDTPQMDADARIRLGRILADAVDRVLRSVDLAFDYQAQSDDYSIVLPATDRRGAEVVLERIRGDLLARAKDSVPGASFSFSIQTVYEKA